MVGVITAPIIQLMVGVITAPIINGLYPVIYSIPVALSECL